MLYEGRQDPLIANLSSDRIILKSLGLDPNQLAEKLRIPEQDLDLYVGTGKNVLSCEHKIEQRLTRNHQQWGATKNSD